jgi:pimeloyl-ACP methyl ester carboxylesterase
MTRAPRGLFVPGWGAPSAVYAAGLPDGWRALEAPTFARSRGSHEHYRAWLVDELSRLPGPTVLAGHSMGAALAISAANVVPDRIDRLVLLAPAGLPLVKPISRSLLAFATQLARRRYPVRIAARGTARVLRAPSAALAVAQAVRSLDMADEMRRVRAAGIPATVVACAGDSLVTVDACRRTASLLGARCQELDVPGGHMWMLGPGAPLLRRTLA